MVKKGKAGQATSSVEASATYRRRAARRRRAEEDRWRSMSGPVTVRQIATVREDQADAG
jgi:hypothetical protein